MYGDDVIYCDVSCMIFVMPCDAEMYCDDLKRINDVSMLDSGSSLYYTKPQRLYSWYSDLLMT